MCARFTLFTRGDAVAEQFHLGEVPDLQPRYNVAPSQLIAVVGTKAGGGGRGFAQFTWGFVPAWATTPTGPRPVNAKSETVAEKPMFRDSFRKRRCLIPADGFYEWRNTPEGKKPMFFRLRGGGLMALAGIWDCWKGPTDRLFTCAILTTSANTLVAQVHDRMPVILPTADHDRWLDPAESDPSRLLPLLRPYPADEMEVLDADPRVNNSRFEGPECLAGA